MVQSENCLNFSFKDETVEESHSSLSIREIGDKDDDEDWRRPASSTISPPSEQTSGPLHRCQQHRRRWRRRRKQILRYTELFNFFFQRWTCPGAFKPQKNLDFSLSIREVGDEDDENQNQAPKILSTDPHAQRPAHMKTVGKLNHFDWDLKPQEEEGAKFIHSLF